MNLSNIWQSLAVAGSFVALSGALATARGFDLISRETSTRSLAIVFGLGLAAYANLMPKEPGKWRRSPLAASRAQSVLRVGGWSLTLAGISYAALWAFAPLPIAEIASMAVLGTATLITIGYGLRVRGECTKAQEWR